MNDPVAEAILDAVHRRGAGRTLCPSEIARALDPAGWRALMPAVREAAARLAAAGAIAVTQRGRPVDPHATRGPVRLGAAPPPNLRPGAAPPPSLSLGAAPPPSWARSP